MLSWFLSNYGNLVPERKLYGSSLVSLILLHVVAKRLPKHKPMGSLAHLPSPRRKSCSHHLQTWDIFPRHFPRSHMWIRAYITSPIIFTSTSSQMVIIILNIWTVSYGIIIAVVSQLVTRNIPSQISNIFVNWFKLVSCLLFVASQSISVRVEIDYFSWILFLRRL